MGNKQKYWLFKQNIFEPRYTVRACGGIVG
jgi:hypothetical protein